MPGVYVDHQSCWHCYGEEAC